MVQSDDTRRGNKEVELRHDGLRALLPTVDLESVLRTSISEPAGRHVADQLQAARDADKLDEDPGTAQRRAVQPLGSCLGRSGGPWVPSPSQAGVFGSPLVERHPR